MFAAVYLLALGQATPPPPDAKLTPLGDGFVRVESATYTIEVPQGWKVSEETPWGQRKAAPKGGGELGVMTAPPGRQSWESLYRTSLYFILREDPEGQATPYELVKRKDGLEAAQFSVVNKEGFAYRRFFLLRHPSKGLLALSVRIPDRKNEKQWASSFKRMIDTAVFLDPPTRA
jgi:hypothetical protein